MKLLCNKNW